MSESTDRASRLAVSEALANPKSKAQSMGVSQSPTQSSLLSEEVYQGLAGFRHAMRRFLAFSEIAINAEGITSQQYQALLVIKTQPDHTIIIKDLARQMLLQANGAVQLVDRLVAAELVERKQSSTDRRSVFVTMTTLGESVLQKLAADHLHEMLKHEPLLADSLKRLRKLGRAS